MKLFRLFPVFLLAAIVVSGCKKDDGVVADATSEEAANIMATSFCTSNAGSMSQMEDALALSQPMLLKSTLYDSSFTISSPVGAYITYQYTMTYGFEFISLNAFQLNYTSNGTFSSPSLNGDVESAGSVTLSGIIDFSTSYTCSGSSSKQGTFSLKIGSKTSVTGTLTTTISDFKFNKETGICESGTANMAISGSTSNGKSFNFTGSLVYTGNYTGTITINGKTYNVNLNTGEVS